MKEGECDSFAWVHQPEWHTGFLLYKYHCLVYTTQLNSAFRALWLVHSEVISQKYSPPSNRRERFLNFQLLFALKITFRSASYLACVVYTKTIIHLNVGESDGYLPPHRWIIVKYLYCYLDGINYSWITILCTLHM